MFACNVMVIQAAQLIIEHRRGRSVFRGHVGRIKLWLKRTFQHLIVQAIIETQKGFPLLETLKF